MRSGSPPLMPIFRSRHQADLLTVLLLHPDQEFTLTDLAKSIGTPLSTLHGEVQRLIGSGLLSSRTVGRARLVRASSDNPAARPLTELVAVAFGPRVVIGEEFADLQGAELVMIFGSWAARYDGIPGPPPHDVDVLVVGRPKRADVYAAAERAEQRLHLPVNPVVRSWDRWEAADDVLVEQIRSSPSVNVAGASEQPERSHGVHDKRSRRGRAS